MTPLPDPHPDACVGNSIDGWKGAYTEEQMLAYGKAEREAALEQAAQVAEAQQVNKSPDYFPGQAFDGACRTCAAAIRALKEKP